MTHKRPGSGPGLYGTPLTDQEQRSSCRTFAASHRGQARTSSRQRATPATSSSSTASRQIRLRGRPAPALVQRVRRLRSRAPENPPASPIRRPIRPPAAADAWLGMAILRSHHQCREPTETSTSLVAYDTRRLVRPVDRRTRRARMIRVHRRGLEAGRLPVNCRHGPGLRTATSSRRCRVVRLDAALRPQPRSMLRALHDGRRLAHARTRQARHQQRGLGSRSFHEPVSPGPTSRLSRCNCGDPARSAPSLVRMRLRRSRP